MRGPAPKWLAFVEPSNLRYLGFDTSLQPFKDSGIVYTPHLYDVDAKRTGRFDPAHAPALLDMASQYQDEAKRLHAALWIGEYGGNAVDPSIGVYLGTDYDGFAAAAAGSTYWAYDEGGGYSMLDPQGNEVPSFVSAVVRPAPARVAGTPIDWSFDAATATFQFSYRPSGSAPTVIMVPPRLYPGGMTIECGGCDSELNGTELSLSHVTGDPAVITISR